MIPVPTLPEIAADPERARTLPPDALLTFALDFQRLSTLCFVTMLNRPAETAGAPLRSATDEVLRPREAARVAGVEYSTFRRKLGKNPAIRVDVGTKRPRYSRSKLEAYLRQDAANDGFSTGPAGPEGTQGRTPGRRPSLRPTRRTLRRGE